MGEISRNEIYKIAECSDVDRATLQKALDKKVYSNKSSWSKFLNILFLSLGTGFTVIGIIFFMAYNWQNLDKFVKIGIVETLIILSLFFVLSNKFTLQVKNITLTATSLLVGALFAVFGQIYQTGANAYDFFLGWTAFITIWVIVANYAPLWLLFSVLINITFFFYTDQVANDWPTTLIYLLLMAINGAMLILFNTLNQRTNILNLPHWYLNILAIATVIFSTATIISIDNSDNQTILSLISIALIVGIYTLGILESIKHKSIFNIALVALSIIICTIYYLLIDLNGEGQILLIALFSITAFSLTVKILLDLQKKWNSGK